MVVVEGEGGGVGGGGDGADIKSNNPHLTGGEKCEAVVDTCTRALTALTAQVSHSKIPNTKHLQWTFFRSRHMTERELWWQIKGPPAICLKSQARLAG